MTSLPRMIEQRDALNRQILLAEQDIAAEVIRTLDTLHLAVQQLAVDLGYDCQDRDRKRERTLTLGHVTVAFAYPDDDYSTGLSVRTEDGSYVDFNGSLPSVNVLKALVSALLGDLEESKK